MEPTPIFACNLRAYSDAMKGRGVTHTEQAKRCNMSKPVFSQLRSGKVHAPTVWTALRLAEMLGVTVDDLLTDRPDRRAAVAKRIFSAAVQPS